MIKKILIVGDAGRGKSTLAENLSKKTGIKHYSTDDFYWTEKFTKRADKSDSKRNIDIVYEKDSWIVEGATHDLFIVGLEKADLIIHLKFKNIFLQYYFLFRRFLKRDYERLADFIELLRHVTYKRYKIKYRKGLATTSEIIHPHKYKIKTLSSYKQIRKFLTTF